MFRQKVKISSLFTDELFTDKVYERIVHWKKNMFMLPSGGSGMNCIRETARLINQWVEGSPLQEISLKATHIMPSILLQKPS